jgi:Family of unknown function (DUF6941)
MSGGRDPEQVLLYEAFVLCDDVRQENNGKLLLIGVYSDIVQVARLPLQLRSLGVVIKAKAVAAGRESFSAKVSDPQGNELFRAGGELNYEGEPGRVVWIPVVIGPALLTMEGPYSLSISLGDRAPTHETFHVRRTPIPTVQQMTEAGPN